MDEPVPFFFKRLILLILLILLLPSCATKMSVEEAKKVTVSISPVAGFIPPPRRIHDITAILEQPGQFDAKTTERFRAEADAAPPNNPDSNFYHTRGFAALHLGRLTQALEDLREANRLAEAAGVHDMKILIRLGFVERAIGNFSRGVQLFEEALKIDENPYTYGRLVETYIQMGNIEKAEQFLLRGKTFCATSPRQRNPQFVLWCDIETAAMDADLLEARAKYPESEKLIRRHLDLVQTKNIKDEHPAWLINSRLHLAVNLLRQERFTEAEIEAREALKEALGLGGKDSSLTTKVVSRMANILRAQGRLPEAEKLTLLVIHDLESSGISSDSGSMGDSRMLLGSILAARGNFTGAITQFELALKGVKEEDFLYKRRFLGNPDFILALLMTGHHERALTILNNTYTKAAQRFGEKHYITVERLALRGMAHYRIKNCREAARDFSTATDTLLSFQMDKADYSKTQRLKIILDDYINLLGEIHGTPLEKELGISAAEAAFRIAEASRGRTVQAALSASSARAAETSPELNDLMRREQDATKQIEVMESSVLDLIAAPAHEQKPEIIKGLHAKIMNLNKARATLQEEIKRRFPKYADFTNPPAVSWTSVQQNLHSGEALLSIYSTDTKTYVWTIPHRGIMSFSISPSGVRELGQLVAVLRKSLDPNPTVVGDIPDFDTQIAYDLYQRLLKPVEKGWKDAADLLFVTCSPLDQIPLSVLITAPAQIKDDSGLLFSRYRHAPWLIRKASITMLPSVSSFVILRGLPAGDPGRKDFAGFGDPVFNPEQLTQKGIEKPSRDILSLSKRGIPIQVRGIRVTEKGGLDNNDISSIQLGRLNRLPDTAEEVRSIAAAVGADPDRDVFLGKDASESRVKTMNLSDRKVIAFATHALVPGDLDGLEQPALALTAPSVAGDDEDGLLTMGEIMKLKMNADWVVLSACNTAAADGSGSEALSGLGRAFFYAGTRAILASMYPVETTSARKLITATFRYQREDPAIPRGKALQKAMIDMIERDTLVDDATGKIVASYAHPLFWAPFIIVGEGGGR
ncbi:MAG: CHAT domain-containing protein [Deltaproteobacteria bacterium]|nr:CHAT domain-containing protein [Deltaproteobacteria bacterium]